MDAQLRGVLLYGAQLQGARLDNAELQGALLDDTRLQGASRVSTSLAGASLLRAQLQGATLDGAHLHGASLNRVLAWRADARKAVWKDTRIVNPETGQQQWSVESFEQLKKMIGEQVPEGYERGAAMAKIERSLDPTKALEAEDDMAKVWEAQERSSPTTEVNEKRLAGIWYQIGCHAEGAPYVLRNLLFRLSIGYSPFELQSALQPALAAAFLDEEHCPGALGLTADEKAKLKKIRDRPPPPAPKQ